MKRKSKKNVPECGWHTKMRNWKRVWDKKKNFTFRNSKAVAIKQLIEGWASQGVEDISSCIGNVSIKVNGEMSLEAKKGSPVEISSASQKL